jgi:hypothetical protein
MRFAKNPPRDAFITFDQADGIISKALAAGDDSTALVQALQFECLLRQIDIVGKWRVESKGYVLKPGEVRRKDKVWKGMTMGMILNEESVLRVRTSKTAPPSGRNCHGWAFFFHPREHPWLDCDAAPAIGCVSIFPSRHSLRVHNHLDRCIV